MLRAGLRSLRRESESFRKAFIVESQGICLVCSSSKNDQEEKSSPAKVNFRSFTAGFASNVAFRGLHNSSGKGPPTSSGIQPENGTVREMESILQRIDAAHFTEVLHHQAKTRWSMSEDEFTNLCMECGASNSAEEALEICQALDKSGVVLRIKNLVYLRPLEVAEILFKALPDSAHEVKARVNELKQQAAPLLAQKAKVDAHANRYARTVLWTVFALFTAQMILYARLTFWELSWDVMEPITYFTSATFAVLAYIYCMWHNEEFGILSARRRISSNLQNKKYAENGLDMSKLDFLLHRINRLEATISPVNLDQNANPGKQQDGEGSVTDPVGLQPVGQGVIT